LEIKLTIGQRIRLALFGKVFVGYKHRKGWRYSLAFYTFRCYKHGLVEDYLHGYSYRLHCPICRDEKTQATHPDLVEPVVKEVLGPG